MEKKFRVGDRVKIVDSIPEGRAVSSSAKKWLGKTMTIIHVNVEFDGTVSYVMKEDLGTHLWGSNAIASLAEDEKRIAVSYDGKTIKIGEFVNDKLIKSSKVSCKTGEDADPEAELKAAIEQFFAKRTEMYCGKIVCVQPASKCFTRGKIYEVVNGVLIDDNGDKCENLMCFKDVRVSLESKFIEIVEDEPAAECECAGECTEECSCECHEGDAEGCDCKCCDEDNSTNEEKSE